MKFIFENTTGFTNDQIFKQAETLVPYIKKLQEVSNDASYTYDESSINLPFDEQNVWDTYAVRDKLINPNIKYIFVVGIGGSNLGTKAIYDALYGFYDVVEPKRTPKIIFLDTVNPLFLLKVQELITSQTLQPEEIVINAVSKSGGTIETLVDLEELLKMRSEIKSRLVITTEENSKLWKEAEKHGIYKLAIPKKVGGRFSVFSKVGLLPLSFLPTINLLEMFAGAMELRQSCINTNIQNNPAALSAAILYLSKKPISVNFFFNPELESLGKWYRQLLGESMGKTNAAITPSVAIGTTDLHSVLQLYLGGPNDKITTFIHSNDSNNQLSIPANRMFPNIYTEIDGKSTKHVSDAIYESVKDSYAKKGLPFMEISFTAINEKILGKFLQFKMIEMMYLCKLFNVNTFDQPQVEAYKIETRKRLSNV